MPMQITATPTTITPGRGYEIVETDPFDPRALSRRVAPATVGEAQACYADFVAALPDGTWSVVAYWTGPDRAPKGFKAAKERKAFETLVRGRQPVAA